MNQSTQDKIVRAIEKLGSGTSWSKLAKESGTSKRSVSEYMHKVVLVVPEEVVPGEVVAETGYTAEEIGSYV